MTRVAIGDITVHTATVYVPAHTVAGRLGEPLGAGELRLEREGRSGGTNWQGEGDTTQLITVLSTPVYDSGTKKITGWRARGGNDTASRARLPGLRRLHRRRLNATAAGATTAAPDAHSPAARSPRACADAESTVIAP